MLERCPRCGYTAPFASPPPALESAVVAMRSARASSREGLGEGRREPPVLRSGRRWPEPPPSDLLALADRLLAD